jgi:signal transduction histidine kinase
MTNKNKLNLSPAALHKVLLSPIFVMVLTINAVFAVSWYTEKKTQEEQLSAHVVSALDAHSSYLSREIFFDRSTAVTERLKEIVKSSAWNPDGLSASLCLHLRFDHSFTRRDMERVCSTGSAGNPLFPSYELPHVPLKIGERHAADLYYEVILDTDGGFIPPNMLLAMILGGATAAFSYLALFRRLNINLIQPAHEKIVRNEKMVAVASFVQMIAHDIRGPFSLIRANIMNLDHTKINARAKSDLLEVIDRELRDVNHMLADVMTIGPICVKPGPTSPKSAVTIAVEKVSAYDPRTDVTFNYKLQHTKKIAVEEAKVVRILFNIIGNAVQAVNQNGSISIETQDLEATGHTQFSITNTGSYVPVDERETVFEAFFTKNKAEGTGLGLASAKNIVSAYGGSIRCDSDRCKGTSFIFTLPSHSADDDAVSVQDESTSSSPDIAASRVVFIDDQIAFYKLWSKRLQGINFHYFSNPEQLWSYLKADPGFIYSIDAVLTDFSFGRGARENGNHVATRIRSISSKPVYLVSNYLKDELEDCSLYDGVFDKEEIPNQDEFLRTIRAKAI